MESCRSHTTDAKKYGVSRQTGGKAAAALPIPSLPLFPSHPLTFPRLPLREHLLHIDRSPAQRLLLKVRVDVCGGLVVGVAHDLHGDQWIDAALVEQRHVVVPEVYRKHSLYSVKQNVHSCICEVNLLFHSILNDIMMDEVFC